MPYDPATTFGYLPEENKNTNLKRGIHPYVHCSVIDSSQDLAIYDNINGSRRYTQWNKSNRKTNCTISLICIIESKKQNKMKTGSNTENKLVFARKELWGKGWNRYRELSYKLLVINKSQGCILQHRKYHKSYCNSFV